MLCLALVEECGFVFFELACGLADSWHVVTALWCFVPESDRRGWNALLSSWLCAVWRHGWVGSDRWYFALSACSAVELSKLDMNNGPTIFWLNHLTNIRQYSILIVTVKHGGYFSEVEHVLSFVFCRRGVQFASGEPLADLAAGAVDVHFGEVACDFDWFSGVFELPEFVVASGFDGLDSALPFAVWACPCFGLWRAGGLVAAFWAGADDDHGFFRRQRLFVASDDVFQGDVVVGCGAHRQYGVFVADDGVPCFPPAVIRVLRPDFPCLFG